MKISYKEKYGTTVETDTPQQERKNKHENTEGFYSWMIQAHLHSPGLVGKLARDMKSDGKKFTRGWSKHRNEAYLEMVGASTGMMNAFNEVWEQYEQYKADCNNDRERT